MRKALREAEGNTLLLTMWEAHNPCELQAMCVDGIYIETELLEVRTASTKTGKRMVLTVWVSTSRLDTDITFYERKDTISETNYVAVAVKKEKVQTWKQVEDLLWKEFRENWDVQK